MSNLQLPQNQHTEGNKNLWLISSIKLNPKERNNGYTIVQKDIIRMKESRGFFSRYPRNIFKKV